MMKTKLGITVGLLGAALYFMGCINTLGLIILAGYVLLFEENQWLKKSAVKAVAIVIAFTLISVAFGFIDNIFGVLNGLLSWFNLPSNITWPLNLNVIVLNAINGVEKLVLVVLGFKALAQGTLKIQLIDNLVDKNM